jgi:hypothetical protein
MSYVPDGLHQRMAHLPVKVVDGEIRFLYGQERLCLKDGAVGTLVIAENAVLDKGVSELFSRREEVEIIGPEKVLMAHIASNGVPDDRREWLESYDVRELGPGTFVKIELIDHLSLKLHGSKRPSLSPCRCRIPGLDGAEAASVNQAYTLISQRFEPQRRSHTGNVFQKVAFHRKGRWLPLEELRRDVEKQQALSWGCEIGES